MENLKTILEYSNASLFRGKDERGYRCNFCNETYDHPRHMKVHFLQTHNDIETIKLPRIFECVLKVDITGLACNICDRPFGELDALTRHLREIHERTFHTDIKMMMFPFKFDSEELRCALCDAQYTNYKPLQEHMHVHFRNFVCDVCNAGFVTKRLLVSHKRRHGVKEFKCNHCEKMFACYRKRRDHEQRVHLGINKKNKCRLCNEMFADYWAKMAHMTKDHGAAPVDLKCQACDRSFNNRRALNSHVRKDHLMERNHVCGFCNKRFFVKCRLRDHLAQHTGDKKFKCYACAKPFVTKKALTQHLRTHAKEKQHECTICHQSFIQEITLNSHMMFKHGK